MPTLYTNATILTLDPSRRVLLHGYILTTNALITSIGPMSTLPTLTLPPSTQTHDLYNKILLPGLINTHIHLLQSLMRGLAEDMCLHDWAANTVWPLETAYRQEDGYAAARLAIAEMLRSGTTTFLEPMLPSTAGFEGVCRAVGEMGGRGCLGTLVKIPQTNPGLSDVRDAHADAMTVSSAVAQHSQFHNTHNGRLHVWIAAETPRGRDIHGYTDLSAACAANSIRLTMHCAEAAADADAIEKAYSCTPGQFCERVGATGEHVVLAHMVHPGPGDVEILARTGTHVAHNPNSNAKLGDGIAPVVEMLEKGVNVSLGTDGAPCNNTHDLFGDMHLAGVIHKGRTQRADVLPAEQVLEMATINAAKALGLEEQIGSLEVGKKADFIVVDPKGLHCAPYDVEQVGKGGMHPATVVVHCCTGRDVDMVVADGEVLVENGRLTRVNEEEIKSSARDAIAGIRSRSGVGAQPPRMGWQYA